MTTQELIAELRELRDVIYDDSRESYVRIGYVGRGLEHLIDELSKQEPPHE